MCYNQLMLEKIAAIFSVGRKKLQKQITAIFLVAIIAVAGSLFALPASASAAPADTVATPAVAIDEKSDCNTQLGAIGWAVCPTTGAIAKAVDYIYDVIIKFIKVNPISSDDTSATYQVWQYARSLTNIVFIIFIMVIIISQVTGFGISNYGIKKSLPRIIIAAILVNLSFIICTLAVDVSNILGFSVHGFFTGIATNLSGGAGTGEATTIAISWGDAITAILAGIPLVGAAGVIGIAAAGGIASLIFMAIPAVLGALVAILSAVITLAARQALITLLVMISPLALVAYLLPNTESLFKKWKDLLTKLLVFFPMFSALFGASQLAGWAIVASSNGDGFMYILGMAVQIFPLIFTPTLLKMSGTVLGKVNEFARKPFAPAQKALSNYSAERRAQARVKHMESNTASASLRRYLNNRRIRREEDTAKYSATTKLRGQAFSASSIYKRNGTLSNRGERLYNLIDKEEEAKTTIETISGDIDKGLDPDVVAKNNRQHARLSATNQSIVKNVDKHSAALDRNQSIKRENAVSQAQRISEVQSGSNAQLKKELSNIMSRFSDNSDQSKERLSNFFASAQYAKNRADKELFDKYDVLFADTEYTDLIDKAYQATFDTKDYNQASAALKNLFLRGDVNLIEDDLMKYSQQLQDEGNLPMQKALNDLLIQHKADDARLSQYGKANNIRRAKNYEWKKAFDNFLSGRNAASGGFDSMAHAQAEYIADFVSYPEFFEEETPITRTFDVNGTSYTFSENTKDVAADLSMYNLVSTINDPYVIATQDRNVFKWAYRRAVKNNSAFDPRKLSGFSTAHFIRGASSGRMDGEQLENMNALLTGGFNSSIKTLTDLEGKSTEQKNYFLAHKNEITEYIKDHLKAMTGNDLTGMKSATFFAFDNALMAANPDKLKTGLDGKSHSAILVDSLSAAIAGIETTPTLNSSTKTAVKQALGIQDLVPRNKKSSKPPTP